MLFYNLVRSKGCGKYFSLFPFEKAPNESHPIKISFRLSNHFMRLNKGESQFSCGMGMDNISLVSLQHRLKYTNSHLNWLGSSSFPPLHCETSDRETEWNVVKTTCYFCVGYFIWICLYARCNPYKKLKYCVPSIMHVTLEKKDG